MGHTNREHEGHIFFNLCKDGALMVGLQTWMGSRQVSEFTKPLILDAMADLYLSETAYDSVFK